MHTQRQDGFDWSILFFWLMATTWGWFLGRALLPGIAGAAIGLAVGILQSLVLQSRITGAWRWIPASAVGWGIGWAIALLVIPAPQEFLAGIVIGGTLGLAQWLVLRQAVHWAGWWIVVSVLGWMTGITLVPGVLLSGVMAGLLSGITLELLLRYPKPGKAKEEPARGAKRYRIQRAKG
jgi:hypothetical protein